MPISELEKFEFPILFLFSATPSKLFANFCTLVFCVWIFALRTVPDCQKVQEIQILKFIFTIFFLLQTIWKQFLTGKMCENNAKSWERLIKYQFEKIARSARVKSWCRALSLSVMQFRGQRSRLWRFFDLEMMKNKVIKVNNIYLVKPIEKSNVQYNYAVPKEPRGRWHQRRARRISWSTL